MNQFYTVRQISEKYQIHPKTVYGWISQRKFPVVKLNEFSVRIEKEGFEDWVEKRKAAGK